MLTSNEKPYSTGIKLLIPLIVYTLSLSIKVPQSFSGNFSSYSLVVFILILICLFLTFRLPSKYQFITFGLILFIFAMTLSYRWTSGFSDNRIIGGLLPYKDGKSYYDGALMLLNGDHLNVGRSTWRPLFPAFLSSLLWLTGNNLKIALAVLVALVGAASYLSAREILKSWGAMPASLFTTLIYFYVQYFIGFVATELLGLMLGCFAFTFLLRAAVRPKWFEVTSGLILLVVALSARAGAFFVLPLMILWVGWIFKGDQRFSWQAAIKAALIIVLSYLLANTLLHRVIGAQGDSSFGNFAYSLYGQVRGGTGWHSAIELLGTRDTQKVYRATINYFLEHPISFVIASIKSYRDFFFPGTTGIFIFDTHGRLRLINYTLWFGSLGLLVIGLITLVRSIRSLISSLLIFSFIGVLLSIPFLPPIDGGSRFYASTMPFFFALVSFGVKNLPLISGRLGEDVTDSSHAPLRPSNGTWFLSLMLLFLAIPLPILNRFLQNPEVASNFECNTGQSPFAIIVRPGSYIDIIKAQDTGCGIVPGICYQDFDENGQEKTIDDFYDQLLYLAGSSSEGIRVIPAYNLIKKNSPYLVQDFGLVPTGWDSPIITGCATEISTQTQKIYFIESVFSN